MPDSRKVRRLGRYCLALVALVLLTHELSSNTAPALWGADDPGALATAAGYSDAQYQMPGPVQMQSQVPIASQSFMDMMRGGYR